jgi:hypothetical protein
MRFPPGRSSRLLRFASAVAVGSLIVGGFAAPATATTTPGTQLWAVRYNGPENAGDGASSVAVSPDGKRVFVTGSSHSATTGNDFATVAYDASSGAKLWAKR